jgi:hypothetical protein
VPPCPAWKAWIDGALAEQDFLDFEEPYRLDRNSGNRRLKRSNGPVSAPPGPQALAPTLPPMKIYLVGGAVRDQLLGLPMQRPRLGGGGRHT